MTKLLTDRPDAAPDSTACTTNAPLASNAVDLTDEAAVPKARLLDLSLTQVLGGSLAAATAAFLGSRLGVVGTIAGASVGSVITATAANLYTNSMHRARDAVLATKVARAGLVASTPQNLTTTSPTLPHLLDAPAQSGAEPFGSNPATSGGGGPSVPSPSRSDSEPQRLGWRSIAVTASVLFAVAAAFLTGVQLTTGTPVTGTDLGSRVIVVREVQPATGDAATDVKDAGAGQGATAPTGTPQPTETATTPAPTSTTPSGAASTTAPSPSTGSSQPTGTAPTGGTSATGTAGSTPSPTTPAPTGTAGTATPAP